MIRDSIKNIDYFSKYIAEQSARLGKFQDKLSSGEVKDDRLAPVRRKIFDLELTILIARYSAGVSIKEIKESLPDVINDYVLSIEETIKTSKKIDFILDTYIDLLWMISITILIGEKSDIERLFQAYEKYSEKDYLLDYLFNYAVDNDISETILFQNEFKNFVEIIKTPGSDSINKIKTWLDETWYKNMSKASWHGEHDHRNDVYFGYWSFESAAIVKILGLDDSDYKNCQYYPYDLLHN